MLTDTVRAHQLEASTLDPWREHDETQAVLRDPLLRQTSQHSKVNKRDIMLSGLDTRCPAALSLPVMSQIAICTLPRSFHVQLE